MLTAVGLGTAQLVDPHGTAQLPGIFGTVAGWVTAGGVTGILGLLIWWQMGNRKLGIEQDAGEAAERADIRDHYAEEVAALRAQNTEQQIRFSDKVQEIEGRYQTMMGDAETRWRDAEQKMEAHYRTLVNAAEDRHEECVRQRDGLAAEVRQLTDDVAGFKRQLIAQSADRVIALGEPGTAPPSAHVVAAAERAKDIAENSGTAGGDNGEKS